MDGPKEHADSEPFAPNDHEIIRMSLTKLYDKCSPCVIGFISRLSIGPLRPHFPPIFGTGFFVDPCGVVATNRHVINFFSKVPPHPKTGESSLAAIAFFPSEDGIGWQMLRLDVVTWNALDQFSSSEKWYGNKVPDIGFVQLCVRDVPALKLATEAFYVKAGMEIATIGYPLGETPLTALGKLNQASPFIRHGIVSSLFPCPTARPHGFTIDIMQQGGSSGSPILRADDGAVVGMMSSGVVEWRDAQSQAANITYSLNTNISIAEPAHVIQEALSEYSQARQTTFEYLPTLAELRKKYEKPERDTELTWDTSVESKSPPVGQ